MFRNIIILNQQGSYRDTFYGTTDGIFQQKRYFTCNDGCGLFVSLDRIYPIDKMPLQSKTNPSECTEPTQRDGDKPTYGRATSKKVSDVDPAPASRFQIGQRVTFYNNKGTKHFGTVGWTGRETRARKFDYVVIGIKTVSNNFQLHANSKIATQCIHTL